MAIVSTELEGKVTLVLNNGVDGDGNTLTKSKSFSKLKPEATDEDIYSVISGMASLQEKPVVAVRKTEEYDLVDQA
ncbi:Protein of unknown function [Dethiosulfatibacter aminovorans DSM 17477]|uniref:DUF1659 domain-containing protein n=1 Tax=Dethiosulfatibacter aminovorans DSM 17477 TaxID=1121476 RepID=A0A1M6AWG1_9FIRM|nr:DUF1659 domain-containing protein [Dethiosulfatibacter aminovorans]SHI40889.1 Protein of unknown function [Dethiosulfatibacter aminovorans DSM 17477]